MSLYLSNSACQATSLNGGTMPVSGFLMLVFAFKLIVDEIVRPEAAAITGTSVD